MTGWIPRHLIVPALLAVSLAAPLSAAQAFRAKNLLYVVPLSVDTFEVIEDHGAGAADIWCAAADYARAAGLDGSRQRMFVLEPRGPARTTADRIGVVFTTNPDDKMRDTPSSYSVSVKRVGENLAVGHAYQFCLDAFEDRFDRF